MKKKIFYLFQSIVIYLFFIISKIIGLKLSRRLFAFIFIKIGNFFKSKKIIIKNLDRIKPDLNISDKDDLKRI